MRESSYAFAALASLALLGMAKKPEERRTPATAMAVQGDSMEWKGQNCAVSSAKTATVSDEAGWKELWSKSLGRTDAPPSVDFTKQLAVAVFLGAKPTGGFGVEFLEPELAGSKAVVSYRVRSPGKGAFVIQAFTQPYAVRLFNKPSVPVEVREAR